MIIGINFCKIFSDSKQKKLSIILYILQMWYFLGTKFDLKQRTLNFRTNFSTKKYFRSKKKAEHHYQILNIRISLGNKFHLRQTVFAFWTKFSQKGYFRSKTEKVIITIKFRIFRLYLLLNFSLNKQFQFYGSNLPKKVTSTIKQKKETSPSTQYILISLLSKFHLKQTILIF